MNNRNAQSLSLAVVLLLALLCCTVPTVYSAGDVGIPVSAAQGDKTENQSDVDPVFCFIVRTYWAHDDKHGGGLRKFVKSLQRQNYTKWEAVLIVADGRPFNTLHSIVRDIGDDRVWVFAEWIGPEFIPKEKGEWKEGYHAMLFDLTDDAIRVCPPGSEYLIVTNGDNEYADGFLDRALEEINKPTVASHTNKESSKTTTTPDIIAFDFYSRYMRPTAPACDRFAAGHAQCKQNHLRWCQTDLGANIIKLSRFLAEKRKFGYIEREHLHEDFQWMDEAHNDGLLMQILANSGWDVRRVTDKCLFNHAPTPQECAWTGGIWDDRDIVGTGGGKCLTVAEAQKIIDEDANIESVAIDLAHDGHLLDFYTASQHGLIMVDNNGHDIIKLQCIRPKNYMSESILGDAMLFYSHICAEDVDLPTYNSTLQAFFPDNWEKLVEDRLAGDPVLPRGDAGIPPEDDEDDGASMYEEERDAYYLNYADEL